MKSVRRMVQSYIEKWYVEIYVQWKLQMDRLAAASHVRVQRTKTSNYRYATSTIANKLLNTMYSSVNRHTSAIQSGWLGTCEQIQNDLWERLHVKLDHGGI